MGATTMRVKLISANYPYNPLEIPANPYAMYPHPERLNYVTVESAKGDRYVFNDGPTRISASIVWKSISYEVVKQYENFLLNYSQLGLIPFQIITPKYMDFGLNKGVDIPRAYYSGSANLKDIISLRDEANLFYDIELPYTFVRN